LLHQAETIDQLPLLGDPVPSHMANDHHPRRDSAAGSRHTEKLALVGPTKGDPLHHPVPFGNQVFDRGLSIRESGGVLWSD
jgi:hypothetical protein